MYSLILLLSLLSPHSANAQSPQFPFQDTKLSFEARAKDLVSRLTLDEKIAQMNDFAPAISRFHIPNYSWHTEGAHGAWAWGMLPSQGESGTTVYPQVIGLAASWDPKLIHEVATATSDEIRAIYAKDYQDEPMGGGPKAPSNGLSIFAPNINIFRDPRWGRGQETYGEDPYLTSRLSVEYIEGLQGDDPKYLKVAATAKHFAVYSGPEDQLFKTNVNPTAKDLRETYLPAFETAVQEGHVNAVMCAYGSVNGAPACANKPLLDGVLRKEWGFQGPIVSDCGAIRYIWSDHHYSSDAREGVAAAMHAGTDLSCQGGNKTKGRNDYTFLKEALHSNLISQNDIDTSVARLFTQRFQLGMFDPPALVPYTKIPFSTVDSKEHRALAVKAAQESMVLLKNQNHLLPLSKNLRRISVIGPNASDHAVDEKGNPINILLGTYHGSPSKWVTALAGIRAKVSPQTKVVYRQGNESAEKIAQGIKGSDVAILVLGLQPLDDDKVGDFSTVSTEGEGRDRSRIELPAEQKLLIKKVADTGVPMVVVLINGSAVASVYAANRAGAMLEAWYPGEEGGTAIADVLFGDFNPSGRLPITFYRSTSDLPAFDNYAMNGRTYRYFKGTPLFSFGDGLSYSHFQYSNLKMNSSLSAGQNLNLSVDIQNQGDEKTESRAGDEVVQVYWSGPAGLTDQPVRSLKAFRRVNFEKNEKRTVSFTLDSRQLSIINQNGESEQAPGVYTLSVGGQQPKTKSENVVLGTFEITK